MCLGWMKLQLFLFFLFDLLFQRQLVCFFNFLGLFAQFEFFVDFDEYDPCWICVWFICFNFTFVLSILQLLDPLENFAISGSMFDSVVECSLEGDLDLFLLVCFVLNYTCCCRVGLSLVWSVVLFVGGLWLMFCFKAFA